MANQDTWYYSHNGQDRQGPFSRKEMREYLKGGVLTPDTLIWAPHLSDWSPARQVLPQSGMSPFLKGILATFGILAGLGIAVGVLGGIVRSERVAQEEDVAARMKAQKRAFIVKGLRAINEPEASDIHMYIQGNRQVFGDPHINAGVSADFPDLLLITVVWPQNAAVQAMVNPNNPSAPYAQLAKRVNPNTLPQSVLDWNCTSNEYGQIFLKGAESECLPKPKE